jgi:hypothetical protein
MKYLKFEIPASIDISTLTFIIRVIGRWAEKLVFEREEKPCAFE